MIPITAFSTTSPTTKTTNSPHSFRSSFTTTRKNLKFTSRIQKWKNSKRGTMQMHMGHSHSHDHLNHMDDHYQDFTWKELIPNRRTMSRVAFSALVTLVAPLFLRNQRSLGALRLTKLDLAAFIFATTTLNFAGKIKQQVQQMVTDVKRIRDFVIKVGGTYQRQLQQQSLTGTVSPADRVTYIGAMVNLVLSIFKAFVGVTCHSAVLVADAGHSLSDLFSDFVTLWAVQIGRIPPDDDHPYGHGKYESIGSLFLSLILLATGITVGMASYKRLMEILSIQFMTLTSSASGGGKGFLESAAHLIPEIPTFPCLIMAVISIFSKEWLFRITRDVGEKLNSQVVIANAWHHRSDAYSSIMALVSIGLAMTFPYFIAVDSAAGLLVAGMICTTGFEILGESIKQLTDTNNYELVKRIHSLIENEEIRSSDKEWTGDVAKIQRVRARQVGSSAMVDVTVSTAEGLSASVSRMIEDRIKWRILDTEGKGGEVHKSGIVFDAEVHAVSPGTKSCPLLFATNINSKSGVEGTNKLGRMSAAVVKEDARLAIISHPKVKSVEGITVHYHDTLLIDVDAHIRLDDSIITTVAGAHSLARELKIKLESNDNIDKANIYLDLNGENNQQDFEHQVHHALKMKNNAFSVSSML